MVNKTFEINGNKYAGVDFSFNTICDLEDLGITLEMMGKKPLAMTRAYISLCMHEDVDIAGEEIQKHIINGGSLDDARAIMTEKLENSDFFRAITERENKETTANQKSKSKQTTTH